MPETEAESSRRQFIKILSIEHAAFQILIDVSK